MKEIFYYGGGEILEQVVHRNGGCPIPGSVQAQVRQVSEQPGLVEDVPAYCWSGGRIGSNDVNSI